MFWAAWLKALDARKRAKLRWLVGRREFRILFPFERLLIPAINDKKDNSFHSIRKSNKKLSLVSLKVYILN